MLAAPSHHMQPVSLELLSRLVSRINSESDFVQSRLKFYIITAFFGCLRYSDMKQLQVMNIIVSPTHVTLHISQSKTDQWRQGNEVVLASLPGQAYCPAIAATGFLALLSACVGCTRDTPVLSSVKKTRTRHIVLKCSVAINTLTSQLREALQSIGEPANSYSLHSFRSGGATAAAASHVPREVLKMHGRWRSDAVDRYIEVPTEQRLAVSRAISGIIP